MENKNYIQYANNLGSEFDFLITYKMNAWTTLQGGYCRYFSNTNTLIAKNIIVNDSPEGMQVSFDTAKIEIRVKKTSDDLADLTEGDIKASIDLKGMSEGSYEVPVSIEIPKGYELVDEVTTGVEISKISTADESN